MPVTPLRALHESLGARFTDFGGWEMPLQYEGVIAEHMAVREGVGVFDVTHLGRFRLFGPGATEAVRRQLCNDVNRIEPGHAQYTMALNDSGGVVDDVIVWRFSDDDYWVMPNGANYHELLSRFDSAEGAVAEPTQSETVLLAVQGPDSPGIVTEVVGSMPGRFEVAVGEFRGGPMWIAGTGYTGERGAEIAVPVEQGPALFEALLEAGADQCGLGARDTLRLEMGYPLWGQDLDEETSPVEAGLEWVVDWEHEFVGKAALQGQEADGVEKRLVAFRAGDRRPPRHGYRLRSGDSVGTVSSGNFSPMLQTGIGMGYLRPPRAEEIPLEMEVRGKWIALTPVDLPFVSR